MSEKTNKDWKKVREDEAFSEEELSEALEDDQNASTEAGALEHPSYAELEERLTLAEQQAHENWEKSVRAMAELENVRYRAERDVSNAHRYGSEKLLTDLLPVLDSLEQALQVGGQQDTSMCEGLELTLKLFTDVLQKHGVQQLNPLGETFNPQEHEAMSMQESPDAPANTVLMVFQKGYKLNDRVIRPARVIVTKGK